MIIAPFRARTLTAVVVGLLSAASAKADILSNPSFETPVVVGNFVGVSGILDGWTVGGTVDLIHTFWPAAEGVQSVDLNHVAAGSLTQTLATTPGQTYKLKFAMAGNAGGMDNKTMDVFWNNVLLDSLTFPQAGHTFADMGWTYHEYTVLAPSIATPLSFVSTTGAMDGIQGFTAFYGPALDDVSVVLVPEPTTGLFLACLAPLALCCRSRNRTSRT